MFYCIILILSIPLWAYFISFIYISKEKKNKLLLIIIALQLCLVGGLRSYNTFNDSLSYSTHFYRVNNNGPFYNVPEQRMEKGYLIFEKFVHKHISNDYPVLFLITSFFTIGTSLFFFKRKSKWLWFSVFLYIGLQCYFLQIQAVRQSIAMVFLLMSFLLLEKGKKIFPILLCFLATTFHSSSIVGLGIIPLYFTKLDRKHLIGFSIIAFLMISFLGTILTFTGYGDSSYLKDENMKLGNIIVAAFIFIILIYSWKADKGVLMENRMMVWGTILCFVCSITALSITALNRTTVYFEPYAFVLLANVLQSSKHKKLHSMLAFIIVLIMYLGVLLLKPGWNSAYPYYFFWEQNEMRNISTF